MGGEAWMDYPPIRLPITRLLLPAALITDDRIIITRRPIKRDQLYSINCRPESLQTIKRFGRWPRVEYTRLNVFLSRL